MRKPITPDVAGAIAAIAQAKAHGRGRKSPVFLWLLAHHDELVVAFETNAPSWPALAAYLGQGGVMNGDGKPPTASSVQNAWARVRKRVAGKPVSKPAPSVSAAPAQAPTTTATTKPKTPPKASPAKPFQPPSGDEPPDDFPPLPYVKAR